MKAIVQEGDPILRAHAKAVPESLFKTKELATIISDMSEALHSEPDGVALAAPQIGVPYRIFIVRMDRTKPAHFHAVKDGTPEEEKPDVAVFINPELIRRSRKRQEADEGCLSVRGVYGTTKRAERTTVRARTQEGKKIERGASGLLAQIFQHEVDHLNGVLFIDLATKMLELTAAQNA